MLLVFRASKRVAIRNVAAFLLSCTPLCVRQPRRIRQHCYYIMPIQACNDMVRCVYSRSLPQETGFLCLSSNGRTVGRAQKKQGLQIAVRFRTSISRQRCYTIAEKKKANTVNRLELGSFRSHGSKRAVSNNYLRLFLFARLPLFTCCVRIGN